MTYTYVMCVSIKSTQEALVRRQSNDAAGTRDFLILQMCVEHMFDHMCATVCVFVCGAYCKRDDIVKLNCLAITDDLVTACVCVYVC